MNFYVDDVQIEFDNALLPWYPWCDGADMDFDFDVDADDMIILVNYWLE